MFINLQIIFFSASEMFKECLLVKLQNCYPTPWVWKAEQESCSAVQFPGWLLEHGHFSFKCQDEPPHPHPQLKGSDNRGV